MTDPVGGPPEPELAHRGDVQALRGVAVLAVVVHHAGIPLVGGFLGVDVFFVLSGFVIGRLLLGELAASGRVALGRFYARRARRLVPALTAMTVATVVATAWLLSPFGAQQDAFNTAAAAQVFLANLQLYRHVGYLEASLPRSDVNPFLHTWSLSVEEQFYVVLPVALWLVWRLTRGLSEGLRRRIVVAVVAAGTVVSFTLSWLLATERWRGGVVAPQRLAFYGAPTRAWELGAGVLVALVAERVGAPARSAEHRRRLVGWAASAAIVGVILVGGALLEVRPDMAHPAMGALGAVVGTALLLVAGTWSDVVRRRLAWRPLVALGDRSYAWYLWHWPAIVLAASVWPASGVVRPVAAVAALVPAAASTRWIERPLRRDHRLAGRRAVGLVAACLVVALGSIGVARLGAQQRWGVPVPPTWEDYPLGGGIECHLVNRDAPDIWDDGACGPDPTAGTAGTGGLVLLLGDSEAYGLAPAVVEAAAAADRPTARWSRAGCPFATRQPHRADWCGHWQDRAWDLVERLDPAVVVVANQATEYLDPPHGRAGVVDAAGRGPSSPEQRERNWNAAVADTVGRLADRGIAVVVVGPVPAVGPSFPVESPRRPTPAPPTVSRAAVDAAVAPLRSATAELATRPGVAVVDPAEVLCDERWCPGAGVDGRWWYWSSASLTDTGARRLSGAVSDAVVRAER